MGGSWPGSTCPVAGLELGLFTAQMWNVTLSLVGSPGWGGRLFGVFLGGQAATGTPQADRPAEEDPGHLESCRWACLVCGEGVEAVLLSG